MTNDWTMTPWHGVRTYSKQVGEIACRIIDNPCDEHPIRVEVAHGSTQYVSVNCQTVLQAQAWADKIVASLQPVTQ